MNLIYPKLRLAFFIYAGLFISNSTFAQAKPCIFCSIARGQVPQSQIVYRDSSVVAFMDHAPNNPGHVLVIPLVHAKEITKVPDSTARNMMSVARRIAIAIKKTDIKADGFELQINSGEAAGQEVLHCHLHVIPRYVGENLNVKNIKAPPQELEETARKIKEALHQ
jgi:histidine triad (HIT) family protein